MTKFLFFILAAVIQVLSLNAYASDKVAYPTKPIKLIVPFPAGGTSDMLARTVAIKLGEQYRQQLIVENRPGASGNIGSEMVSKSPADGYTLLFAPVSTITSTKLLYANATYDPMKDLAPVALVASVPLVLVVRPDFPETNANGLVRLAKRSNLTFASTSKGLTPHLAGELFMQVNNLKATHIPFNGDAPALTGVMGGHVDYMFVPISAALSLINSGKLRGLGVTSVSRNPAIPNIPTFAEEGMNNLELVTGQGFFAPAKTPKNIIQKLNTDINAIVSSPELTQRITNIGGVPGSGSAEEFQKSIQRYAVQIEKIVTAAGIKPD